MSVATNKKHTSSNQHSAAAPETAALKECIRYILQDVQEAQMDSVAIHLRKAIEAMDNMNYGQSVTVFGNN